MTDYVGRTLGPYRLEMALGKGGMATVYRAYQSSVKRYVAIKVMAPEIADQPGFVERFEREAEVIAALEHPHILPIIDYGNADGIHYLVMRYIEGGSLDDRMRRKALTLKECARLLEQMASALDYAHQRGVIHRDLKPNNVLLDSNENGYLTDFGIARMAQSEHKLTATGSIMGTPAYMSPEQGMGRPVDARSDLYTLGVVLYEMALNRLPFSADTPAALIFQHVYEQPTPPQQIKPDLPDSIAYVLNKAMAKSPDDRYQSGAELSEAFADAVASRSTPQRSVFPPAGEEGTIVGGPIAPIPAAPSVRPTAGKSTQQPQPSGPTIPPTVPPVPPTASGSSAVPTAASSSTGAGVEPTTKGLPVTLIAAVVVILLLLGGGGFLFINSQNANQTATAVALAGTNAANASNTTSTAIANGTGTAVAFADTSTAVANTTSTAIQIIALSATKIPTATFTASATLTPNVTLTQLANQMATVSVFNAGETATTIANVFSTASARTAIAGTQAIQATQTRDTQIESTAEMQRRLTVTAEYRAIGATSTAETAKTLTAEAASSATAAANITATARSFTATPTRTPTPRATATRTKAPSTPTPTFTGYNGLPEAVVAKLQRDGVLPAVSGSVAYKKDALDVLVKDADSTSWNTIDPNAKPTDFVIAAEVQWSAPDEANECGFVFRYNEKSKSDYTFYVATISRHGTYQAGAYDHNTWRTPLITQKDSSLIQTDDEATNHILLIGRGSSFQFFVNGKPAGTFSNADYTTGSVGVMGSRGTSSTSLTCQFRNIWAYTLKAQDTLAAGLTSTDPNQVIGALTKAGVVTGNPRLVVQEPSAEVTMAEPSKFRVSDPMTQTTFTNFVLSTDLSSNADPANTERNECGIFYNGKDGINNLAIVYVDQHQNYGLWVRKGGEWASDAVKTGKDAVIKADQGAVNRLTLVLINNTATLFVNGTKLFEATDTSLTPGQIGYYVSTGKVTEPQTCSFSNTSVWRLN